MKDIGKLCQLMERFDGHGGGVRVYVGGSVTTFRKCDSQQEV